MSGRHKYIQSRYRHTGFRVTPYARAPKPAGSKRCKWCGELTTERVEVMISRRGRSIRAHLGVESNPDGRAFKGKDGRWWLLRQDRVPSGQPMFRVHSEFDCAAIPFRRDPPDRPYPEESPRSVLEYILRQEIRLALDRQGY